MLPWLGLMSHRQRRRGCQALWTVTHGQRWTAALVLVFPELGLLSVLLTTCSLDLPVKEYFIPVLLFWASLVAQLVKNPPAMGRPGFDPWAGKIPWRRERLPTPVFWPGEFPGLYSLWGFYIDLCKLCCVPINV